MGSPQPNGHRASPASLLPHPDAAAAAAAEPRGRDPSPRGGYGSGRKGYNARPPVDFTPPASSHGGSPRPAPLHRDGLFGRKGYNGSPGSSPAASRENSPVPAGPTSGPTSSSRDGNRGRKGYNAEAGPTSAASAVVAAVAMGRSASHDSPVRTFANGLSGHRRSASREPSPAHPAFRAPSPAPPAATGAGPLHSDGSLGSAGRKGYSASPRLSPALLDGDFGGSGGYHGRKGYNSGVDDVDPRRPSPSPARGGGPQHLDERQLHQLQAQQLQQQPGHAHRTSDAGLGLFGHDGPRAGRKGYSAAPGSRSASPQPPRQ